MSNLTILEYDLCMKTRGKRGLCGEKMDCLLGAKNGCFHCPKIGELTLCFGLHLLSSSIAFSLAFVATNHTIILIFVGEIEKQPR